MVTEIHSEASQHTILLVDVLSVCGFSEQQQIMIAHFWSAAYQTRHKLCIPFDPVVEAECALADAIAWAIPSDQLPAAYGDGLQIKFMERRLQ